MDADTLVPELVAHVPSKPIPSIIVPAVKISGFIVPIPSSKDQVVIPLEENEAIFDKD